MMIFDNPVPFLADDNTADPATQREDLATHQDKRGVPVELSAQDLLSRIEGVELTGRGGGHFPVARKLQSALDADISVVAINGSEGEYLSSKDAALLQLRPHLILDGAQAIARAVRARKIVVWLHHGSEASIDSVRKAIAERRANLFGEVSMEIHIGPARYLTGEGSAVINGVLGKPVLPSFIVDPAKPWGENDAVLVHNVESHARVGLLVHVEQYQPSSLVTITSPEGRTVLEVDTAITFDQLFTEHNVPKQALLLGGVGGQWVRWETLKDIRVDHSDLKKHGLSLGAGILALPSRDQTPLEWAGEMLDWLAGESAGQCGPCVFGLKDLSKEFKTLTKKRHPSHRRMRKITETMELVEGRGACRLPDGAVRMARSAIDVFEVGAR